MCLIITQPAGHTLAKSHLLDIAARNGDGFGIMRADGGTLRVWRVVSNNPNDMLRAYYAHAAGRACVLHWRMATHGAVDVANAHPFRLTRDIAVVHNGVLDVGTPTAGKSDTWHMARHVLAPIARDNPDALFTPDMAHVLGGMIGTSNKLVFLHADGRMAVVNEASGVHHAGRWYSNTYAWDAPTALRPKYAPRYTSWLLDDDDMPTTRDAKRAPVVAPVAPVVEPITLDVDDDPRALLHDMALDDLSEHVARDDADAVGAWVDAHPDVARDALCDAYAITPDDAAFYLRAERGAVVEWLMSSASL